MSLQEFQLPNGTKAQFEIPDGMSPQQAEAQIQQMLDAGELTGLEQASPDIAAMTPEQVENLSPEARQMAREEIERGQASIIGAAGLLPGDEQVEFDEQSQRDIAILMQGREPSDIDPLLSTDALEGGADLLSAAIVRPIPGISKKVLSGPIQAATTIASGAAEEIAKGAGALGQIVTQPFADDPLAERITRSNEAIEDLGIQVQPGAAGQETFKAMGEFFSTAGEFIAGATPEFLKDIAKDLYSETIGALPSTAEVQRDYGSEAAAIYESIPEGALIAASGGIAGTPARTGRSVFKKGFLSKADDSIKESKTLLLESDNALTATSIKAGVDPEVKDAAKIAEDIKNKKDKLVIEQLMPDEDVLKAADELGIDLNPAHYSRNENFIKVQNTITKKGVTPILTKAEDNALESLQRSAKELTDEINNGSPVDISLFDQTLKTKIVKNIDDLENQADKIYKKVNARIPAVTRVKPTASKAYIDNRLAELGGDTSLLTSAEKRLLALTKNPNSPPTYGALDTLRRDVGNASHKKQGVFKDDDKGTLDQIYKVLLDDQQGVADAMGAGAEFAAARKLVFERKSAEKQAQKIFGRDIAGSIVPGIVGAGRALTKGDVSKFNSLMKALPEGSRGEAAAGVLDSIFASTKDGLPVDFVKNFKALNKNPAVKKILFDALPAGAKKRFDNIGKVSSAIVDSKALKVGSVEARQIIDAINSGGLFSKLMGVVDSPKIAGAIDVVTFFKGGIPLASFISNIARKIPTGKSKTIQEAITKADALLTSPVFEGAAKRFATGKPAATDPIMKTSVFKKWLNTQPPSAQNEITRLGLMSWLVNNEEPQPTQ